MPKYYEFKIAGYYLYFTSFCVIECMHVHASDRKLTEAGSAKFFVKENGDTELQNRGILNDREIAKIQAFIKENYKEMLEKQAKYTGDKNWNKNDVLNIPFIKINNEINYDELCGRLIKGTNWYIRQAIQTIDFELNNYGGSVKSEALIEALKNAVFETGRKFIYNEDFILYLKEEDKEKPYFALKVDNTDVLVAGENN